MKARVGNLPVGTRFVTTLTGRVGTIRAQWPGLGETDVHFGDGLNKALSGQVVVETPGAQPPETIN